MPFYLASFMFTCFKAAPNDRAAYDRSNEHTKTATTARGNCKEAEGLRQFSSPSLVFTKFDLLHKTCSDVLGVSGMMLVCYKNAILEPPEGGGLGAEPPYKKNTLKICPYYFLFYILTFDASLFVENHFVEFCQLVISSNIFRRSVSTFFCWQNV